MNIQLSNEIKAVSPTFRAGIITCHIVNTKYNPDFWDRFNCEIGQLATRYALDQINKIPAIAATRAVYKALGKDPNRYRPSAEALMRRVVKGESLYQINTAVDLINAVSLRSGYSIGGFDRDKIAGETLTLGVGETSDIFEAIGRGTLNITGLPVYRDLLGGIGTPTSDEERTKLDLDTTRLLMIINAYSEHEALHSAVEHAIELLSDYVSATQIEFKLIQADISLFQ